MKDIEYLRNCLFDQLSRLSKASGDELKEEIEKSASVVQVAEAIIKTGDLENQFLQITQKAIGSGFIPSKEVLFDVDKEKNWLQESGDKIYSERQDDYDPLEGRKSKHTNTGTDRIVNPSGNPIIKK